MAHILWIFSLRNTICKLPDCVEHTYIIIYIYIYIYIYCYHGNLLMWLGVYKQWLVGYLLVFGGISLSLITFSTAGVISDK